MKRITYVRYGQDGVAIEKDFPEKFDGLNIKKILFDSGGWIPLSERKMPSQFNTFPELTVEQLEKMLAEKKAKQRPENVTTEEFSQYEVKEPEIKSEDKPKKVYKKREAKK